MMEIKSQSPFISTKISGIPAGVEGKIHVVGRNDMAIPMTMGITWEVKDPDGIVVESHTDDWAGWPVPTDVNPGSTHEFISPGSFDLNKAGTWTIVIGLFMNSAAPVEVASYSGILVVVTALAGSIVKKELEYDSVRGDIPVQ